MQTREHLMSVSKLVGQDNSTGLLQTLFEKYIGAYYLSSKYLSSSPYTLKHGKKQIMITKSHYLSNDNESHALNNNNKVTQFEQR